MTENPFTIFDNWYQEAERLEPRDPNAMCLATVGADGRPSARMVLLKGRDENGFVFYTNFESRKGEQIQATKIAALCFHWKSMNRQIRIEGAVEVVSDAEADAYFATRARGSRIAAWASSQSRDLENMDVLKARVAALEKKFDGVEDIPRPPYWSGFRVVADRIEFWEDRPFRLHKRDLYIRNNNIWTRTFLYP